MRLKGIIAATALLALSACDLVFPRMQPPVQRPKPAITQPVDLTPTSERSAALRSYLRQLETTQLEKGLLRQEPIALDAPFTADALARNFNDIVFFNEYDANFRRQGGASPLRRWSKPVRLGVIFGESVTQSQREQDLKEINTFAARLGRVARHPVSVGGAANFIVIVASEDDRDAALDAAIARVPGISTASVAALRSLRRDTYCVVAAYATDQEQSTYSSAIAVIRAENPALLRKSCIHEELAQGLGLANDSPQARPSIFNDDDEFALLTRHDELLLAMLYDERLRPGMSAGEAAPITQIIARELLNGPR